MKPLDRRGFLLATLGSLVAAGLVVIHARRGTYWSNWLIETFGPTDAPTVFFATFLIAGIVVVGLWCWFVARRFVALLAPRWPAMLPFAFWSIACLLVLVAQLRHEPFPISSEDRVFSGERPDEQTDNAPPDVESLVREQVIVQNLALSSLGFAGLSIIAATWCAVRAFRRSPIPIEDHFA